MLKMVALFAVSILVFASIISALEHQKYAEALRTQLKKIHENHYSYWQGNVVCGDKTCPKGTSYAKWNMKYRTYKSPYDEYSNQALAKVAHK